MPLPHVGDAASGTHSAQRESLTVDPHRIRRRGRNRYATATSTLLCLRQRRSTRFLSPGAHILRLAHRHESGVFSMPSARVHAMSAPAAAAVATMKRSRTSPVGCGPRPRRARPVPFSGTARRPTGRAARPRAQDTTGGTPPAGFRRTAFESVTPASAQNAAVSPSPGRNPTVRSPARQPRTRCAACPVGPRAADGRRRIPCRTDCAPRPRRVHRCAARSKRWHPR